MKELVLTITSVLSKNKINISYDSLMNEALESLAYYWVPLIEDIKTEEEKHKDDQVTLHR